MKITVIKNEEAMSHLYWEEVALIPGMIHLDWEDYQAICRMYRPLMAVLAEGDTTLSELLQHVFDNIRQEEGISPKGFVIVTEYGVNGGLKLEELNVLHKVLSEYEGSQVEIKWGLQCNESLESGYRVLVFVFE